MSVFLTAAHWALIAAAALLCLGAGFTAAVAVDAWCTGGRPRGVAVRRVLRHRGRARCRARSGSGVRAVTGIDEAERQPEPDPADVDKLAMVLAEGNGAIGPDGARPLALRILRAGYRREVPGA